MPVAVLTSRVLDPVEERELSRQVHAVLRKGEALGTNLRRLVVSVLEAERSRSSDRTD